MISFEVSLRIASPQKFIWWSNGGFWKAELALWDEPNAGLRRPMQDVQEIQGKVLVAVFNRMVVMEVGILYGVCNSSPTNETSPKNGWSSSVEHHSQSLKQSP
ncbi:hypothetical protein NPIL_490081 [Nephila pilipes]|uniref:Uncharacterized protein n=1 Tax=Nephila pilipes TaxID=299642 RepID=A0A8X6PE43_NEPPI|nr:hypothetical protein NPIL_490081 [Nephila pilipes]